MLTINNLSVQYHKSKQVLDKLNLRLHVGQIHGLIGLNGAGKTTLLNAIYGFKAKNAGEILFENKKLVRKQIAYLESENFFYSNITGKEYLNLFPNKNFDLDNWNKIFNLPLHVLIENYSSGMKKRLALFGILKLNKPIMIFDEPFNGIDLETSRALYVIISQLREQGKTVIITSHILESLTNLCDRIHYLENKRIKFSRTKEQFDSLENDIFKNIDAEQKVLIRKLLS